MQVKSQGFMCATKSAVQAAVFLLQGPNKQVKSPSPS